jgi:hypothetical protein
MTFLEKQCYEKIVSSFIGKRNKREVSSTGNKIISQNHVLSGLWQTPVDKEIGDPFFFQ